MGSDEGGFVRIPWSFHLALVLTSLALSEAGPWRPLLQALIPDLAHAHQSLPADMVLRSWPPRLTRCRGADSAAMEPCEEGGGEGGPVG